MRSDLHRAFRSLARRRTFAVIAALTLALAFSIPAVVLSTLDRHFWRPLDLPRSNEFFTLTIWDEEGYFSPLSHPEYLRLRELGAQAEAFSLAAFGSLDFTMVAGDAPARVDVTLVSGDFFTLLGAAPTQGRLLAPSDDDPSGMPLVAVVSHRAWTTRFGRDPGLVGRTLRLGPQAFTVVGVAANPLPGPAHDPDFWVPLSPVHQLLPDLPRMLDPIAVWLDTVGRLDASASRGDAEVLAALARDRLPVESAEVRTGDWRFVARSVNHLRLGPEYHREAARFLTVLAVITGIFLLAACSNMVLLLLTRGARGPGDEPRRAPADPPSEDLRRARAAAAGATSTPAARPGCSRVNVGCTELGSPTPLLVSGDSLHAVVEVAGLPDVERGYPVFYGQPAPPARVLAPVGGILAPPAGVCTRPDPQRKTLSRRSASEPTASPSSSVTPLAQPQPIRYRGRP